MTSNIKIEKPFILEIDGKTYTLEFTPATVTLAERAGFSGADIGAMPLTMITLLFWAAFQANHPEITRRDSDDIYFNVLNGMKNEEIEKLVSLYKAVTDTLIYSGGERKNVKISL